MSAHRSRRAWPIGVLILASIAVEMLAIVALFPQPEILVAFDTAFAASRPELVAEISRSALIDRRIVYTEFPLDTGPSSLVEFVGKRVNYPLAIAVSPFMARALVEGAARNGAAPPGRLVVIEGAENGSTPDLPAIRSDPLPAYRRAGELLGGILADYRSGSTWSGDPAPAAAAALFFSPGAGRPEAGREAFIAGWALKASFPLRIEEIPEGGGEAETASRLRTLMEGDLKAILMAVGGTGIGALKPAMEPGRVTGLVSTTPKAIALAFPSASFVLHPDDKGIVAAIRASAGEIGAASVTVPWLLDLLPGSKSLNARDIDLASRIEVTQKVP